MAEAKNYGDILKGLQVKDPEIYNQLINEADLTTLMTNPDALSNFEEKFNQAYEAAKEGAEKAEAAVAEAVVAEVAASENQDNEPVSGAEAAEKQKKKAMTLDAESEEMLTDPYSWEKFYAPAPEEELKRFDEALGLLDSKKGQEYQKSDLWKSSNIHVADKDGDLNETLNTCSCRRIASNNDEITLDNIRQAREAERIRIETEYYNAVYAIHMGDEYSKIKAEKHFERIANIEEAVRAGKSEEEIYNQVLKINPKQEDKVKAFEQAKALAHKITVNNNMSPVADFVESRGGVKAATRRGLHNIGKWMDKFQKFEQKNPLFSFGLGAAVATVSTLVPPVAIVYGGYRAALSARAIYNDFQGFKDYATFRDVYKDEISKYGFEQWKGANQESKISEHDYSQVKAYGDYDSYLAKHKSNHVSEEDFKKLKDFQKKSEFTRENFEMIRQSAGMSYADYQKRAGDKAVSEELFNSLVKYTDIRRTMDYEEYKKQAGSRAVSETEYNQVKLLSRSMDKVSIKDALRDNRLQKSGANFLIGIIRPIPYVGPVVATAMATKKLVNKHYWRGLKAKALGTREAIKTLRSVRGNSDENKEIRKAAWRDIGNFAAEVGGFVMLGLGMAKTVSNVADYFTPEQQVDGITGAARTANTLNEQNNTNTNVNQNNSIVNQNDSIVAQNDSIVAQNDSIVAQNDSIVAQNDSIVTQNDSIVAQNDSIVTQNDSIK